MKKEEILSRMSRKQSWCLSVLSAFLVIIYACPYYDL